MKRAKSQEMKVYAAGGGMQLVRRVSGETALRLEARGAVRREYCPMTGILVGFRIVGLENRKVDSDVRSIHSSSAIDRHEMNLNIDKSRTIGLPELERLARIANGKEPEDRAERVKAKVRVYLAVGPGKGDILRVWPR